VTDRTCDCLIVGGGPAGLTGALYLARFLRRVIVIDEGKSRASAIRKTHNHPGFADGIAGDRLISILRAQAVKYGAIVEQGVVKSISRDGELFVASTTSGTVTAGCLLIATGIQDTPPDADVLDRKLTPDAIRYCPVCDGFEAIDKSIAVYGVPDDAGPKADFLRTYSRSVTVLSDGSHASLRPDACDGVALVSSEVERIEPSDTGIKVTFKDRNVMTFDILYPAMGATAHSHLAVALGAAVNEAGCLMVDAKQQTTVVGVFAAGDVVTDLHQLVVAEGHAAVAATAIHKSLPPNLR